MADIVLSVYDRKTRKLIGAQGVVTINPDQGLFIDLRGGELTLCYAGETNSMRFPTFDGGNETLVVEVRRPDKPVVYGPAEPNIMELIS